MLLGKKMAIFYWEWGQNSAPREGQKIPCQAYLFELRSTPIKVYFFGKDFDVNFLDLSL